MPAFMLSLIHILDRYVSPVKAAQSGGVLEGVEESEAVCTVQAELKNENLSEFVMLYGLTPRSGLWRICLLYTSSRLEGHFQMHSGILG